MDKAHGISIDEVYTKKVSLRWEASELAEGYKVFCYSADDVLLYTKNTSSEEIVLNKLNPATIYHVCVRTYVRRNGTTVLGAPSGIKKITTVPERIKKVRVKKRTKNSVTITWSKKSGASAYRIYLYRPSRHKYVKVAGRKGNTCTIRGLKKNTTYRLYVVPIKNCATKAYEGAKGKVLKVTTRAW